MVLARIYPYTKFEVSSFTRSKGTAHVPLNGWMRYQNTTRFDKVIAKIKNVQFILSHSNIYTLYERLQRGSKRCRYSFLCTQTKHFEIDFNTSNIPGTARTFAAKSWYLLCLTAEGASNYKSLPTYACHHYQSISRVSCQRVAALATRVC